MDVLFCAGGGALAVLQHVFPFTLVGVAAGFAGDDGPAPFLCGLMAESWRLRKTVKPAQFDKIETLQDRF